MMRRKLPSRYLCPKCGTNSVSVVLRRKEGKGRIICAHCGLKEQFPIPETVDTVDAYCIFVDRYYGVEEYSSE
ncbi:hypothetical protein GF326_11840 [Candidatus Bathyarchaeota archaeon]|nr:hypothetical protein [Candidatus Bathyarchaeota archaeon]